MTKREISRAEVCLQIGHKQISQTQGTIDLGLSTKQMQRIYKKFQKEGASGLVLTLRKISNIT